MSKARLILTLGIIGIIIAGLLLAAGCTGTDEGDSSGSGSGGVRFEGLTSLTRLSPDEATVMVYADMKSLMEDTDLGVMYEDMEDQLTDANELGIAPSSVNHFGMILVDYDEVMVIGADLDLNLIHAKLAEEDSESADYLGFEVWLGGDYLALAILDDTLLMGAEDSIKACLDAIDSGQTAYESSADVRDILGRVPDGIMTMVMLGEDLYPGSVVMGVAIEKISSTSLKLRSLMKFESESDAADAEALMKAGMEMTDEIEISVSRSGRFVEFSTEVPIDAGSFFG